MTNFEKIKNFSIEELAEFLDGQCWNDDAPWSKWFNDTYCSNCEPIEVTLEGYHRPIGCAYCELENKCRFFDHYLEPVEMCQKWLESKIK